jgi:hypothetical protein
MTIHFSSSEETRKRMADFLATTHYFPKPDLELDEHGFPIVEPEPDDPDDE